MAKQTFTTGQVLTAAQMTSLQQTAMGGGSATAKTASYVLVAADAGGTVAMNAAGATTITVNTGLFAAGDTVFIQNLGAGACTVTPGSATVASAGSLILPQYDAGILYFTATGVSIFYDYIQAGGASPLTTKGDVYTFSTSDARLGVGANNTVLTADSAEATGLKWAAPAGGGKVLQVVQGTTTTTATLNTTTLSDTNLSATITPTSATSSILVMFSQSYYSSRSANACAFGIVLKRGSTTILDLAGANKNRFTLAATGATATVDQGVASASFLDAPATTSATTYKTQAAVETVSGTDFYLQVGNTPSTIILLEIGA